MNDSCTFDSFTTFRLLDAENEQESKDEPDNRIVVTIISL